MNRQKYASCVFGAVLLSLIAAAPAAHADGMPESKKARTPLDKALDEIQNRAPPVPVTKQEPEEKPAEQTPPPAPQPEPAPPTPPARIVEPQPDSSFFGFSIGAYDPVTHGKITAAFNVEWQPGVRLLGGHLQPLFGAFATTHGALMAYGGIGVPIRLTKHVFLMPSLAAGGYHKGRGVDLGRTFAVRAGTELAYEFDDRSRIGFNIHAISNGESFSRKDRTEIFSIVYTIPFDLFSGRTHKDDAPASGKASAGPPATADEAIQHALKK